MNNNMVTNLVSRFRIKIFTSEQGFNYFRINLYSILYYNRYYILVYIAICTSEILYNILASSDDSKRLTFDVSARLTLANALKVLNRIIIILNYYFI